MNCVNLIGNVAVDPELKKTNSGKDVTTIRIGVTRTFRNENGARESDFVNVQCWEQTARYVDQYVRKGDMVAVTGELREREYTAQDGQKRHVIEVLTTKLQKLTRNKSGAEESGKTAGGRTFAEVVDDDLPF